MQGEYLQMITNCTNQGEYYVYATANSCPSNKCLTKYQNIFSGQNTIKDGQPSSKHIFKIDFECHVIDVSLARKQVTFRIVSIVNVRISPG